MNWSLQPAGRSASLYSSFLITVALVGAWSANSQRLAAQVNGQWASTSASGSWASALFWQGGNIAGGDGALADFSQLTMTNDVTVHLDGAQDVGSIIFGDRGNTYNWTVDLGNSDGNTLNLANPTTGAINLVPQPTITVVNGTATISGTVTGTQGFILNPQGQAGTLVLTGQNTFFDDNSGAAPANVGFGAITVDGGTLSIASDAPPGSIFAATPSPLGFLPPGGTLPFPVSGASVVPANIWLNGGALQATATFQLNSHRGIALGATTGGGGGTINVTTGSVLTYGLDSYTYQDPYTQQPDTLYFTGIISDYNYGSSLTLTGGGTLLLTTNNTYTGATNITGAGFTLQAGIANALSPVSGVSIASGATFLLNGFSQRIGSLAGAGSVTNNTSSGATVALTVGGDNASPTFSGVVSNTTNGSTDIVSLLAKVGSGNQTLSTSNGASWGTTGPGGGYDLAGPSSGAAPAIGVNGGVLTLDLSHATTQTNLINPYYALQLGGGTLNLAEAASSSATLQTFNGTTIKPGNSAVTVTTNGSTSSTGFALGAISRLAGGTVDFNPGSASTGAVSTTNSATPFLGGWATVGATDWAGIQSGGNIAPLTSAGGSYANDGWNSGNNTTVTTNDAPTSGSTTNSLRFNAAGPSAGGFAVTLAGANTISSGGVLVTVNAGANGATIGGAGTLTSGNGADLIVDQFDSSGSLTIGAQITGGVSLTKSGPGTLLLTNSSNNYTGGTTINSGIVGIASDGALGAANGAVTLNGGTLQATTAPGAAFALNSNRNINLGPASGYGGGTINVGAGTTLSVNGAISNNGSSTSSLTKTGPGTLMLNAPNPFTGGFYINQGTVVPNYANDSYNYSNTITPLGPDYGWVTFTGSATIQYSGTFIDDTSFLINSGAIATLDDNSGAGGQSVWVSGFALFGLSMQIKGGGGLNFVASFGGVNSGALYDDQQFYANAGNHEGLQWTYSGPTTVYVANFEATFATSNGVPFSSAFNTQSPVNLGGTIQMYYSNNPGGPSPTQVVATQLNLIADTSSAILNDGLPSDSQIYINSVSSNGIVRAGGSTINFGATPDSGSSPAVLYVANGGVSNTSAGIIGGWATYNGTDWATVGAGGLISPLASYSNDTWASGNNTTVTLASHTTDALTTYSLRFAAGAADTLTLSSTSSAGPNVITSGGILVSSAVGGFADVITGGFLTSGNGADLIVNQFNTTTGGSLTIASAVVNNGGAAIGLTLGGNTIASGGTLILTNSANAYTGPTVITAATTLQVGAAGVIPSTSAVIISMLGTLNLNGFNQSIGSLANFNGSLSTLAGVNFGYGTTVTAGTAFGSGTHVVALTIGGDNTSTAFNGALLDGNANNQLSLAKVGSGTLTLGNFNDNITNGSPNLSNYSGGTTITAGTLDILYDADLGAVPAAPTTNITFNGNVGAPTLQFDSAYMGTSLSTNRSILVATNSVGYVNTNGNPLITYAGLITVNNNGTFGKAGAGVFELDAPPNLGTSSLVVSGGTLRLNYGSAATITAVNATVSSGATLELAGSTAQLSQSVNVTNAGTFLVSSSAAQQIGVVSGTGNSVVNTGGNLTAYEIRQNSLTISGNAVVTLSPSGSGTVGNPQGPNNINFSSNVTTLSIGGTLNAWTGTLDIGNNGLVVQYGSSSDPYTTVVNMIESGYNGGNWGGTGIASALAQASIHTSHPLNIGLVDFTPNHGAFATQSSIVFEGQTITTNAVLVRLTYMDDLVLSGDMAQNNATNDALLFAANYGIGTTWSVGDITHDGLINSNDALLFAANYFINNSSSLDGTTGAAVAVGGSAAVPEPATILLAGLGAISLGLHSRRWPNR